MVQWSVSGGRPAGLSVTGAFNVVVACCDSTSVHVYTPLGCPVCQLDVRRPGLVGVSHAVQLDCGWLVLVGVTESAGRLACVHRDSDDVDLIASSGCPSHLALVRRPAASLVWIAERRPTAAAVRLVQVPASKCSVGLPTVHEQLEEPSKICWDDRARRLYVVDRGHLEVFHVRIPPDLC